MRQPLSVFLAFWLAVLPGLATPQYIMAPGSGGLGAHGAGGSAPTFVQGVGDFTGGGTLAITVTAGNHLVVWTVANDTTTTHTCSNNGTANTYVPDATQSGAAATNIVGRIMHVKTLAASATITITCTGTTPLVAAVEYSGGTGDLDTTASGTNPSTVAVNGSGAVTPAAFTPTTAATILVNGYSTLAGGTITLSQVDGSYTTRASCLTGASCFVGGIGTRVVASAASYTDGWTNNDGNSGKIGVNAAYK